MPSEARATELLEHGLRGLLTQPPEALVELHGLEPMEVARVLACGELARRLHDAPDLRTRLRTPTDIYTWARPRFLGLKREEFHVLCLNNRNVLLRHVRITEGSVDQCQVDPREAFAPAVATRASCIVLLHNHPSGDPEPSVHDVALTRPLPWTFTAPAELTCAASAAMSAPCTLMPCVPANARVPVMSSRPALSSVSAFPACTVPALATMRGASRSATSTIPASTRWVRHWT